MTMLIDLYDTAYLNDITVVSFHMNQAEALSVMTEDGDCYIALDADQLKSETDEIVKLAHDLGHCMTGSFYNRYSKFNSISQKEYRADKWAVHKLLPFYKLQEAFENGIVEVWELAEYFEVTEDFIETALLVYRNEGALAFSASS